MGETTRPRLAIDRADLETVALLLLDMHARRQLALPKNRVKGVPSEDAAGLISCAHVEVIEALDAVHDGLSTSEILAELGDVAAFVGMAMWRVVQEDPYGEVPFPTSYRRAGDRDAALGAVVRRALALEGFDTDRKVDTLVKYFSTIGMPRMERVFRPIAEQLRKETDQAFAQARGEDG